MSRAATCASLFSLAALVAAGCLAAIRAASGPLAFDHAAHAKRDLDCKDCHEGAATKPAAGMPGPDFCANCHDPKSDRPELAAAVADYARAATTTAFPSAAVRGPTYRDVKFDHAKHGKAGIDCAKCHEGAAKGALASPAGPLSMDTCVSCHMERGAKSDCATCHTELGKDARPPNHQPGWLDRHGFVSRAPDRARAAERCDACHARADCDGCHAADPPRDHTSAFRNATHGLAASMDRSRCTACHEADSCTTCHETKPPRSHRGSFGEPNNRHCISCHLPVGSSSCVVCHKGTPSHDLAPAKPPTVSAHRAALGRDECLSCHRRVSHPVGVEDCNACHR